MSIKDQPSIGLIRTQPLLVLSELVFFILAFSLLLFPKILYGTRFIEKTPIKKKNKVNTNEVNQKTSLDEENPLFETIEKIKLYLEESRPYTNPDFSINNMSLDLKIPVNLIKECLQQMYNKRFTEIKKELRVNYAIFLLENNYSETLTIDAISQKSGFSTRSNFYNAFKSLTSITPTEYVNSLKNSAQV